jgi:hypothetical protein
MKNEEKILELLAEYLVKTDRSLGRIEELQQEIRDLQKKNLELSKETLELRKESLKYEISNDVLLKETLSISRRVQTLAKSYPFTFCVRPTLLDFNVAPFSNA